MPKATATYGFIGLGQMGHGMASNLRRKLPASCVLWIYDINTAAVTRFVAEFGNADNVRAASSPRQIYEKADTILTSVPQGAHVRAVFLSPDNGLLAGAPLSGKKALFMELSTINAADSSTVAAAVIDGGYGEFVDAPCSGGSMGAEKGTLSFMVGSPDHLYREAEEVCKMMASEKGIFHCGNLGAGLKTKLLNNYLSSLTTLATAETINIGMKGGLDPYKLNEVLNASSGMSFNSAINNPVPGLTPGNPASKGYVGGFSLELCLGVLELALKAATDLGANTTLGQPLLAAYRQVAKEEKYHGKDAKVIYKWIGGVDPAPRGEAAP